MGYADRNKSMKQHSHGPYFEGWYMKFQTNDGSGIALIPALHIDAAGGAAPHFSS